ncbi:ABC transporter substrate-binding protein [Nitrosococcus wardiae]|uniref:ABC transporter substrate-binding protein n=1 Tax=Nitrosococcus wardiae TaxID=1814290 RepID=A0A4P7C1A6_9GAMM|nr:ABC transporter substrate-binding protein [Nitrosococcus wardiae]QBQ55360.1 ABC transporter substrate-binding protein [Nitrosococcus wardiae]
MRAFAPGEAVGLLIILALLTGCGSAHEDRNSLRLGLATSPLTLDPRYATDATSARLIRLLYQPLVDLDASGKPVPVLADWQRLSPTRYRFRLRPDRPLFHDGSKLSARDVKATYASVLDPGNGSPLLASLEKVRSIEVPDPEIIEFVLTGPDPLFPGRLTLGIVPAPLLAESYPLNRAPVGSGPFRFEKWPEEGRLILRRRRDGQRFEFLHVPDPTVRVLKLLRSEIHMLQNDLPKELVAYLEDRKEISLQRDQGNTFTYLGFNLDDPVTGHPQVRLAIAHALNRQEIIRYVFKGTARPAQALLPPEHWAGHPALPEYPYDPMRARTLLRKAGFDTHSPAHISYKTSSDPFRVRLATIIQHQLRQVGIEMEVQSYDWGTFYGDIKAGRFQMYSLSWVGVKLPDAFGYIFHSESVPPQGANRGHFEDPQSDFLIEQAGKAGNLSQQANFYRQLQARLLQQLPYVPLWYEDNVFAARQGISGYQLAPDGNYDGLAALQFRPES